MTARKGEGTSALVVHAGFNGIDDIFSGVDNYYLAYAPKGNPSELVEKLGERYEIARTNIKKWTVGSPIQAPLDATYNIMKKQSGSILTTSRQSSCVWPVTLRRKSWIIAKCRIFASST